MGRYIRGVRASKRRVERVRVRRPDATGPLSAGRWRGSSRPWLGLIGGQAEMTQDAFNGRAMLDERQQTQPPAAPGTRQHVEAEGPPHQLRPEVRTGAASG